MSDRLRGLATVSLTDRVKALSEEKKGLAGTGEESINQINGSVGRLVL